MATTASDRRLAENEVVFREYNEKIQRSMDELNQIAKDSGQDEFVDTDDDTLHFYCECSDENCTKRVTLSSSTYDSIHKERDCFVIVCGHEVPKIEDVIVRKPDYCVVRKKVTPPEYVEKLHTTDVNNV